MVTETLTKVKAATDAAFKTLQDNKGTVPAPSPVYKEKLDALEEAKLPNQRNSLVYEMRLWQAENLGFQRVTKPQMVEMLMGVPHSHQEAGAERHNHEYVYFHNTHAVLEKTNWGGKADQYYRRTKVGAWYLPPFLKKEVWRVQFGTLDNLKREIPYGVVLRINELKKLYLFNAFGVCAPMEAWEKKTGIDPIVYASIWEMPLNAKGESGDSSGLETNFFLAQW